MKFSVPSKRKNNRDKLSTYNSDSKMILQLLTRHLTRPQHEFARVSLTENLKSGKAYGFRRISSTLDSINLIKIKKGVTSRHLTQSFKPHHWLKTVSVNVIKDTEKL